MGDQFKSRFLSFARSLFEGLALTCLFLIPIMVFAQDVQPPTDAEWMSFIAALGGMKGLGTMGIVAVVVQGLMLTLRMSVGEIAGKYRLLAVLALSLIGGVIGLKASGLDWGSALVHSTTLAAFQVLLNQMYKQFFVKAA